MNTKLVIQYHKFITYKLQLLNTQLVIHHHNNHGCQNNVTDPQNDAVKASFSSWFKFWLFHFRICTSTNRNSPLLNLFDVSRQNDSIFLLRLRNFDFFAFGWNCEPPKRNFIGCIYSNISLINSNKQRKNGDMKRDGISSETLWQNLLDISMPSVFV